MRSLVKTYARIRNDRTYDSVLLLYCFRNSISMVGGDGDSGYKRFLLSIDSVYSQREADTLTEKKNARNGFCGSEAIGMVTIFEAE